MQRAKRAAEQTHECPKGHAKVAARDGKLYCPQCASDVRKRGRRIDTYFQCGHRRDETQKMNRLGIGYCGICRVQKRLGINSGPR